MHKIFLPIDTKSLYCNIFNDNLKGHTCTVATPIKQGNAINEELLGLYKIPKQIDYQEYPDLICELLKNSKSQNKINNVFIFDKIKVNGKLIDNHSFYCMFVKEETDPTKVQFGRIKLHYPKSLSFNELNIDNKSIMELVSRAMNDYAFVVDGFEFDFDDGFLNFIVSIVGYKQIPYSKVFRNVKGTAEKFTKVFRKNQDCYDAEIVALKKKYGEKVEPTNFQEYMDKAILEALDKTKKYLISKGASNVILLFEKYPYSIFDIQYTINGKTQYSIVKTSYTNSIYFDLTSQEMRALALFEESSLFFVTNVFIKENLIEYRQDDLDNFERSVMSIRLKI